VTLPYQEDSLDHNGPQKRYKSLCMGVGSLFCLQCSAGQGVPEDCPVAIGEMPLSFQDGDEGSHPCHRCTIQYCPCKKNPPERQRRIMVWWDAKQRSAQFERENWLSEVEP